ncbi:ribonuclease HIII [Metamycoplasma neophronis]|uniref:Ribonuclease n=1 Tax=Metamycoplasma neophronis TaxID=872983 RepID=A0ABY2Z0Z9_9BACT|nr:ribonuclease HIII [Metamycoplasma neophronis]
MDIDYDKIIGVDETGVGDYFCPIVSVACFIPEQNINKIKSLGVKDSKKLTDKKILAIAEELENLVLYRKTILSQKGYNNLINAKINNNEIKTLIHMNSINQLIKYLGISIDVIIDQYTNSYQTFEKHFIKLKTINWLNFEVPLTNFHLETKAEDKSLAVACASIIARKLLLEHMEYQNHKFDFNFKLGAGKEVDILAAQFLEKYGYEVLCDAAKISFKTTQKALEIIRNK